MGLLSFFQRKSPTAARGPAPASEGAADAVQHARARARRRLVGAVLLLGIGIIGFPLLFETQPRPIPVDIPIEIPRKDNAPALAVPAAARGQASQATAPRAGGGAVITETAADAGREVPARDTAGLPPIPQPAASSAARAAAPSAAPKTAVADPAPPSREATRSTAPESRSTAAAKPAAPAPVEADAPKGRVVIQVGAFGEAGAVREARAKVEKLGLKSYTQVVETDGGKRTRVRVGPFATRDEAEKAAARIKAAGLQAALLTL